MRRVVAIAVLFLGTAAAVGAVPDDGTISKMLPGRWTTCVTGGSETEPDGTILYDKAGTFVAEGTVKLGASEKADVRVEGTWKVESRTVTHKVTKSSHPGLAPVGGEMKEHVLAIDDKAMRIKRGIGKERTRERMKE
jgi:hypothetical protein